MTKTVKPTPKHEWLMALPRLAALAFKLGFDRNVPWETKSALGLAMLYIISPIDGIPDFIPVIGQLEDMAIAILVIDGMVNHIDRDIVLRHWTGRPETLDAIGRMTSRATRLLPGFIRNRVMKKAFRSGWNPGPNGGQPRYGRRVVNAS